MYYYHFGIPGPLIWAFHILFGIFIFYLGYQAITTKKISKASSAVLIILGSMAVLYHVHLWLYNQKMSPFQQYLQNLGIGMGMGMEMSPEMEAEESS